MGKHLLGVLLRGTEHSLLFGRVNSVSLATQDIGISRCGGGV
jgi:hypothetical protein